MYNLKNELSRIGDAINSSEAKDSEQFMKFYNQVHKIWGNRVMEWVRFDTFESFRDGVQALLYVSMFYSSFITKAQDGLSEHTGYSDDMKHTYSWWKLQTSQPFVTIGDTEFDTECSWFEIRQPLERQADWFEVRVRISDLVNIAFE